MMLCFRLQSLLEKVDRTYMDDGVFQTAEPAGEGRQDVHG
jgi:hypothetical protein